MFRHKNKKIQKQGNLKINDNKDEKEKIVKGKTEQDDQDKTSQLSDNGIKELLEKNLKWSQIIYEQNRRLNHKLIWTAVAGWLRLVLILAPLIFAIFYLSPFVKQLWQSYNGLLGITSQSGSNQQIDSLDNLFKVFNLNEAQQNQIKNILN